MTDTLRSIYEQCAHLRETQLEFLPADSHRQKNIILRDLNALGSAAFNEQDRSVVLLSGALFEALLYSFIQGQADYIEQRRGEFTFRPEHDLNNFVNIFNAWFSNLLRIPDIVVAYRNTIHINCELELDVGVCPRAARDLLRQLELLVAALDNYARS